ncbi:MAG: hypothetical protein WHU10_11245 [Fimbriimonadales bacterium]
MTTSGQCRIAANDLGLTLDGFFTLGGTLIAWQPGGPLLVALWQTDEGTVFVGGPLLQGPAGSAPE